MAIELDPLAGPEGKEKGRKLASHWQDQVNAIKDSVDYKRWFKRGQDIEKRYRDERNRVDNMDGVPRHYNALWSNVEILKPALYGRTPIPVAERRFKDRDPVGRSAASMIERALRNEIEICGYDEALQQAVGDYLLPGRGVVWVRYEPLIEEGVSLPVDQQEDQDDDDGDKATVEVTPGGRERGMLNEEQSDDEEGTEDNEEEAEDKLQSTDDRVIRESTPVDFILWSDFMSFPARARTWKEITGIGKRVYMSRDQLIKRFGRGIGKAIPLHRDNRGQRGSAVEQTQLQDKAQIYEIWDKDNLEVIWIAEGYEYLCDRKDDPLRLEKFFPVPRPLFANATNNTLVPVPDFIQYQDQADQVDDLTQRIAMLTKACKMTGLYNAAQKDIQRVFSESVENQLIPVDDWSAFAEAGGIEGNWSLMPVKDIIGILNELMGCKERQIEEMNSLTGINDIMRGTSDARETLGGVRLKRNSTGTRLTSRQNEVARFARDTVRIMADIMCQHFSPQSLIETSGALYEEGLGPDDMPNLSNLQDPSSLAPPPPPVAQPGAPSMGGPPPTPPPAPPQGMAPPQAQPPAPMAPPQPPMGGNVIPFRPPQQAPVGPQMGMGAPQPQQPQIPPELIKKLEALQRIAKGIDLLRQERTRGFRIDIEVDSTIFPDSEQEKQDRTEFLAAMTQFLQQGLAMGATAPEAIPLMAKMMQFGIRGWRVGRDLENAVEEFSDQAIGMSKQLIQQRNTQPNPEMMKLQIEDKKADAQVAVSQAKIQADKEAGQAEMARQQLENEGEARNAQIDLQSNQIDLEIKLIDKRIEEMRLQMEVWRMKQEMGLAQQEAVNKQNEMVMDQHQKQTEMAMDAHSKGQELQLSQIEHQQELKQSAAQHKQDLQQQKAENKHDIKMQKQSSKADLEHQKAMHQQKQALAAKQAKAPVKK